METSRSFLNSEMWHYLLIVLLLGINSYILSCSGVSYVHLGFCMWAGVIDGKESWSLDIVCNVKLILQTKRCYFGSRSPKFCSVLSQKYL